MGRQKLVEIPLAKGMLTKVRQEQQERQQQQECQQQQGGQTNALIHVKSTGTKGNNFQGISR
jgi:hypothetical protein